MEIYNFNIENNPYEVKIISIRKRLALVEVNGIKYEVEIDEMGYHPPIIPPVVIEQGASVSSGAVTSSAPVKKPAAGVSTQVAGDIMAPMPGQILEIKVSEGDEVNKDDVVIVMEAMKMQNQIKAGSSGTVDKILVKVDDAVGEGDPLISIK